MATTGSNILTMEGTVSCDIAIYLIHIFANIIFLSSLNEFEFAGCYCCCRCVCVYDVVMCENVKWKWKLHNRIRFKVICHVYFTFRAFFFFKSFCCCLLQRRRRRKKQIDTWKRRRNDEQKIRLYIFRIHNPFVMLRRGFLFCFVWFCFGCLLLVVIAKFKCSMSIERRK